jgi:hypothetical protein
MRQGALGKDSRGCWRKVEERKSEGIRRKNLKEVCRGVRNWTFKLSRCLDHKPIPDLSRRALIDTSNPVKRSESSPVLNQADPLLCVDVNPPLYFRVGVLDSSSSGCKLTLHRF